MLTDDQEKLIEWIDTFIYENYRPPELDEVMEIGIYRDRLEAIDDRRSLIQKGILIPSVFLSKPKYFVPVWMIGFIDYHKKNKSRIDGLIKLIGIRRKKWT